MKMKFELDRSLLEFLFGDREVVRLARVLISIDLFFVMVHGIKYAFKQDFIDLFGYWIYRNLTITNDWALPEIINYLKFVVIIYLLCRVYAVIRQPVYLAFAFVFTVALLDDSLQVHEGMGAYISNMLGEFVLFGTELQSHQGLRVQDIGELIMFAIYGSVFSLVLGIGFLRSQLQHRKIGVGFGLLLGSLAFFAVVVDVIDRVVASYSRMLGHVVATIEDSGEMFVVSLTVAFAFIVYRRHGPNASQP